MLLKLFLNFYLFQPHVSYRRVSYKKTCTKHIIIKLDVFLFFQLFRLRFKRTPPLCFHISKFKMPLVARKPRFGHPWYTTIRFSVLIDDTGVTNKTVKKYSDLSTLKCNTARQCSRAELIINYILSMWERFTSIPVSWCHYYYNSKTSLKKGILNFVSTNKFKVSEGKSQAK